MGKLIKIIATTAALLIMSCGDPIYTTKYRYINESGVDIVMEMYVDEVFRSSVVIKNGDTHTDTMTDIGDNNDSHLPLLSCNNIKVVFDNKRVLMYARKNVVLNNPFRQEYYKEVPTKHKYTSIYEYTFTSEHYDMAVPIEEAENAEN